jgi:hypothetical protein
MNEEWTVMGLSSANRRCVRVGLFVAITALLSVAGARADYWGAALATATPEFLPGGKVPVATVRGTPDGTGVVSEAPFDCEDVINCTSVARLYVAVTEPRGTTFETIWLRAFDNDRAGYVRATLYRQNLLGGAPEFLGSVTTQDSGHQVVADKVQAVDANGNLGPVEIGPLVPLEPTYTYYIEVAIVYDRIIFNPPDVLIAYDVGFDLSSCSSPELPGFDGFSCF